MSKTRRTITAGMIANALAWYDFTLYGYFALLIGKLFFPGNDQNAQLIEAYGVFAAGFLMRPIGGVLFGFLGDKFGRKLSLVSAIVLMAVSTALIGMIPAYSKIGIAAPVLLTVIRLFQGIALAGQYSGTMVFTVEHAPNGMRGLAGSMTVISLCAGMLLGSSTGTVLSSILTPDDFVSWGWRIPFLFGLTGIFIGMYIAYYTEETPHYELARSEDRLSATPIRQALREHLVPILRGIGIYFAVAVPFYTLTVYCTGFLSHTLGMPLKNTYVITTLSMIIMVLYLPVSAFFSDIVGRKPVMMYSAMVYFFTAIPIFYAMNYGYASACFAMVIFTIVTASYISIAPALLVELFPTSVRYTGMALSYNIAAVLGGFTPMVETWLVSRTGNPKAVAIYIMLCASVSFLSFIGYKDSYREKLEHI